MQFASIGIPGISGFHGETGGNLSTRFRWIPLQARIMIFRWRAPCERTIERLSFRSKHSDFCLPPPFCYLINWAEKNGTQRIARYAPIISQTSFKRRRFTSGFFFAAKWNFFFFLSSNDSFIRVEKYHEIKFSLHFVYKYVRTRRKSMFLHFESGTSQSFGTALEKRVLFPRSMLFYRTM